MNSSISNSYVNIYIASAAVCRDIICSWEYCRRTVIQNPCTFILRLQSKDRTKGSSSRLHTEFSNEKQKINAKFYVWILRQNLLDFRRGFPQAREEAGCCPRSQLEGKDIWRVHQIRGICKGKVENHHCCLYVAKHGCQRIHFSKHWKLPKKRKKYCFQSWQDQITFQSEISSYSVFS